MGLVQVSPQVVNDIEFYASKELDVAGLSISGLARLCGIDRRNIGRLLEALDDSSEGGRKTMPELLQPLQNKVFVLGVEGINGAKIVDSNAATEIIYYYAFESKHKTEIAAKSFKEFCKIGLKQSIFKITGEDQKEDSMETLMKKLLLQQEIQSKKIDKLTEVHIEYNHLKHTTRVIFPNLDKMHDDLIADDGVKLLPSGTKLSLGEWLLNYKSITLTNSAMKSLARMVADTYKSTTGVEPPKGTIKKPNGQYRQNLCLYSEEYFPLLEMCYRKFVNS